MFIRIAKLYFSFLDAFSSLISAFSRVHPVNEHKRTVHLPKYKCMYRMYAFGCMRCRLLT